MNIKPIVKKKRNAKILGFTLVELISSIVVIAISVIGTLLAIQHATRLSGDPMLVRQAIAIAESYIDEIRTKSFSSGACPAVPGAGGRANFTYICHYNGISQVPTDQNGNAITGLGIYTVTVSIDSAAANLNGVTGAANVNRIDVTVSHPRIATGIRQSEYRTNY